MATLRTRQPLLYVASTTLPPGAIVTDLPPRRIAQALTWIVCTPLLLIGKDAIPPQRFVYDYPNPKVRDGAVTNRTWIQPTNLLLIGKDAIPPQRFQYDQSVPVRRPARDVTWLQNGLLALTANLSPFDQVEWPLPKRRVRSAETLINPGLGLTAVVATAPFYQTEWPPPRRSQAGQGFVSAGLGVTSVAPFKQLDWANPGRRRGLDGTWATAGLSLTATPGPPFYQTEWPLPKRQGAFDETWVRSSLDIATVAPFFRTDWPLPGFRRAVDGTWLDAALTLTLVPDAVSMAADYGTLILEGQDVTLTATDAPVVSTRSDSLGGKPDKSSRRKKRTFNPWEYRDPEVEQATDPDPSPAELRKVYTEAVKADVVEAGTLAIVERFRRPSERVDWKRMAADVAAARELVRVVEAKADAELARRAEQEAEDDDEDAIFAMLPHLVSLLKDT